MIVTAINNIRMATEMFGKTSDPRPRSCHVTVAVSRPVVKSGSFWSGNQTNATHANESESLACALGMYLRFLFFSTVHFVYVDFCQPIKLRNGLQFKNKLFVHLALYILPEWLCSILTISALIRAVSIHGFGPYVADLLCMTYDVHVH